MYCDLSSSCKKLFLLKSNPVRSSFRISEAIAIRLAKLFSKADIACPSVPVYSFTNAGNMMLGVKMFEIMRVK